MNTIEIISIIFNVVLGGSWLVTFVTLRSKAKQAAAEARADELKNVESAIKIWRELAEDMTIKYNEVNTNYEKVSEELKNLTTEVTRLRTVNSKILKLLDKMTAENFEKMVEQIKNELK